MINTTKDSKISKLGTAFDIFILILIALLWLIPTIFVCAFVFTVMLLTQCSNRLSKVKLLWQKNP